MKNNIRLVAGCLALGLIGSAQAITFSGVTSTASPFGVTLVGSNAAGFQTPAFFLSGAGVKAESFTWTVTATPGFFLTGFRVIPNGAHRNGEVLFDIAHNEGVASSTSSNPGSSLTLINGYSRSLSGTQTSYTTTGRIKLTGNASDSFVKLTSFVIAYDEQPVPEPATLTALGLGAAALLRRKGGRK